MNHALQRPHNLRSLLELQNLFAFSTVPGNVPKSYLSRVLKGLPQSHLSVHIWRKILVISLHYTETDPVTFPGYCLRCQYSKYPFVESKSRGGGGRFFNSKGTWRCAFREGMLLRTPGLARVYFLVNLVWARACFSAILVKGQSNFCNSCIEA